MSTIQATIDRRLRVGVAGTLRVTLLDGDGQAAAASGAVTVDLTRADGTTIEADESQDGIEWDDERLDNVLYVESGARADPTPDGQDEAWELRARARFYDLCPSCNGYIQVRKTNGSIIHLLTYDPEAGGGGGGGG